MTTILIINFAAASVATIAAASRQFWAFARNGGVPFSHFFAPVHTLFLASCMC
jgi:amino acid transporter